MTAGRPAGRFGARLAEAVTAHGPLCAGIDPHAPLLAAWGLTDDAAGVERFGRTVVAALAGHVACVKPQAAFFERHGSRGVAALERVLADAREAGLLTIVDAKRGDIGSTMDGYAEAFAGDSPLAGDAVTVSPYLGFGSLRPVLDLAAATGRGVFVLALTSNPEGAGVQHATGRDGRAVARVVAESAAAENAGAEPFGDVGLVVGATVGSAVRDLGIDLDAVNGPLLAPGVGAQGATAEDLRQVFGDARRLVLAASSREVLRAGPEPVALRDAARRSADAVRAALSA
ncbi:orotidine-5'-phosphate decarboxylase [Kineococcus radiotolerans]|uniref:Orotidine 5'-phosphate decarboxylase n=1 Tax=Kineococcus radiotolerans TaxID=131568 RepID=A0A7W4TQZ7_KINRA|nr:orotidine-5'-phosphate decarboxylase [Kineococcus radiotolerans]MBB2902861.1 orotidine-5'-phosphate decarboxylase [Kineococcus radiotolerans]